MNAEFIPQAIPEVVLIKPKVYGDNRGFFLETYKSSAFAENGISDVFVQDNQSVSPLGTLRGLHYQAPPHDQGKLVRVLHGRIYDVAVDIRKGSPTYGKYVGVELDGESHHMLWVPSGFAHGFVALEDDTLMVYKCSNEYNKDSEGGLLFSDPEIGIPWPIPIEELNGNERDMSFPVLKDLESPFTY